MKRIYIVLVVSVLFLSCNKDEPNDVAQGGPTIDFSNFSYEIGDITATSIAIRFAANSISAEGGQLIAEIWYKKAGDSDWSIKDITNTASQQDQLLSGLELATKYIIKPVFTVGELVKEGSESVVTTMPFPFTAIKDGLEQILLISSDTSIDFQTLDPEPLFHLKFGNDSIPMPYNVISKDSILVGHQANNSVFFEGNTEYVEKFNTTVSFQYKDYYEKEWKPLEIFNKQPKINSLDFQEVITCTGSEQTKLRFSGLFWNARDFEDNLLEADEYAISIKNVQDSAITTPVFVKSDFIDGIMQGCEIGVDILLESPVQNRFHSGSILWVSFSKDLLPEGSYQLEFSAIADGVTYTAEPHVFELAYD